VEIPKLVIKVGVERGEELLSATISLDMAGRFLEYLGSQLRAAAIASMPVKADSPARKVGEEGQK